MALFGSFGSDSSETSGGSDSGVAGEGEAEQCSCPGCGGCAGGLSGCSNPAVRDGLCRQCAGERADDGDERGRSDAAFETGGCGVL